MIDVRHGDAMSQMLTIDFESVDLTLFSPPYEDCRTYGIGFSLEGQEWVKWVIKVIDRCVYVTKGLVACVVQGKTRNFRWSATPALLMARLHEGGYNLRVPPIFHRQGIPGSGGPDWFRNDYEYVVCVTRPGRLLWSDVTACGHPPKYPPGGDPTHRTKSGRRVRDSRKGGEVVEQHYTPPVLANPGNVISGKVGGGHMGSPLAHENEAPFPEWLAERFILSFCPPGGTVLDPMCGSGTTLAVAQRLGRNAIGIDIRESQVELTRRRLAG